MYRWRRWTVPRPSSTRRRRHAMVDQDRGMPAVVIVPAIPVGICLQRTAQRPCGPAAAGRGGSWISRRQSAAPLAVVPGRCYRPPQRRSQAPWRRVCPRERFPHCYRIAVRPPSMSAAHRTRATAVRCPAVVSKPMPRFAHPHPALARVLARAPGLVGQRVGAVSSRRPIGWSPTDFW